MVKKFLAAVLLAGIIMNANAETFGNAGNSAVATQTKEDSKKVLQLSEDSFQLRQLQTRKFNEVSEETVLKACVHVLQDLGFNIENSEPTLGLVKGIKTRDAMESGQVAGKIILAALLGVYVPIDKIQNLTASIVVSQGSAPNTANVRVNFARLVWNEHNQVSKAERLESVEFYQEFYEKLSKSLFLEAHQI